MYYSTEWAGTPAISFQGNYPRALNAAIIADMAAGGERGESQCCLRYCPLGAEHFRLLQHRLRRLFLLVGRIAVLAQDALHDYAELRSDVLANRPVDSHVLAYRLDEFARDFHQRRFAEHFDRAV